MSAELLFTCHQFKRMILSTENLKLLRSIIDILGKKIAHLPLFRVWVSLAVKAQLSGFAEPWNYPTLKNGRRQDHVRSSIHMIIPIQEKKTHSQTPKIYVCNIKITILLSSFLDNELIRSAGYQHKWESYRERMYESH